MLWGYHEKACSTRSNAAQPSNGMKIEREDKIRIDRTCKGKEEGNIRDIRDAAVMAEIYSNVQSHLQLHSAVMVV